MSTAVRITLEEVAKEARRKEREEEDGSSTCACPMSRLTPMSFSARAIAKQKLSRISAQPAIRNECTAKPRSLNTASWFAQGLGSVFCPYGPGKPGNDLDVSGFIPATADGGGGGGVSSIDVTDLNGWDVAEQLFTSLPSSGPSAATVEALIAEEVSDALNGAGEGPGSPAEWELPTSTPFTDPSTANDGGDLDNGSPSDAFSWQLTDLSLKIARAKRRLAGPGSQPPTPSSPEVTEALEYTNTLIHIFNEIVTASSSTDKTNGITPTSTSTTTTASITPAAIDNSVILLALASHQHLMALFEAICDAIRQCLDSVAASADHMQNPQRSDQRQGQVGAFSVAHFVMVLQLLMHLTNRIDRSLYPQAKQQPVGSGPTWPDGSNGGAYITPVTDQLHSTQVPSRMEGVQSDGGEEESPPQYFLQQLQGGLPALAVGIVEGLPDQLGRLRKVIQGLQTMMEN